MVLIKTRSGRFIPSERIIALSIEEDKMPLEGRMVVMHKLIVALPEPFVPAILGIFLDAQRARNALDHLAQELVGTEQGIIDVMTEV
jgi:hypothetical protein